MLIMEKNLAIKGHSTRGKEVIQLLQMLGGKSNGNMNGYNDDLYYYIAKDDLIYGCGIEYEELACNYTIFTLEEFLEKYPFKVGDKVRIPEYESETRILRMKWFPLSEHIEYLVCSNDDGESITVEWFTADELLEYNDNPNKTTDCKKCGIHFGSVQCFDKDCPNNTPKSNAVGLKDGKVIDCKVNKEMDINDEVKPIFKVGDEIAKADGLTNSFTVNGVTSKYYSLVAPYNSGVGVLPVNEQDEYILVNRAEDKEPEPKAPILSNRYDYDEGKCGYVIPDGYEFDCIKEGFKTEIILKPKKPTYPKTYVECCDILDIRCDVNYTQGYKCGLINKFQELFIARNAYWKIAGEQMGLGKNWEPDWSGFSEETYPTITKCNGRIIKTSIYTNDSFLAFPSEEMRNVFYESFKELIEQCKELL